MTEQNTVAQLLKSAEEECERLGAENIRLRAMLGIQDSVSKEPSRTAILVADGADTNIVSAGAERKIALFRSLFRGREDVYAVRWEGKNGKSGYSPAGVTDWRAIYAARPEDRKKVARKTRMLQPLTDKAIRNHLIGKLTIGIYPLLPDETCWFLAVDFDKKSWVADAAAFAATCRRFRVPIAVERSRSGNGAHIWLFFDCPVAAVSPRLVAAIFRSQGLETLLGSGTIFAAKSLRTLTCCRLWRFPTCMPRSVLSRNPNFHGKGAFGPVPNDRAFLAEQYV